MFGKKPNLASEKPPVSINVQTIPADFYGGVNPVVKFKNVEKEIIINSKPALTSAEKKMLDRSTAVGGEGFHVVDLFSNRKYAALIGAGLFVLIVGAVGGYYVWQSRFTAVSPQPAAPKIEIPSSTFSESVGTSTISEIFLPTTTTSTAETSPDDVPIDFPSVLLGDSPDLDEDGVSDVAEDLFATDPSKPDTDEDSYTDGHEIFYLYNPAGKEPERLIESGYVTEYENPVFGYKLYYPRNWAIGTVDNSARQVLISTITGENIEIRTFDLMSGQTVADWFAKWVPNEGAQARNKVQTRFFEQGESRADSLVYYFYDSNHVYVLLYHTTDSNAVHYRSVMVMMARSFRSAGFVPPENVSSTSTATDVFPSEMPASINPGS
jgi:hypothetical protein